MFSPPSMGYDRAITIFSPDGRLYQVEYAQEAVKRGLTAIGIVCVDGGVLIAERRKFSALIDEKTLEKVIKIDDHIGAAYAGLGPDARVLMDAARTTCQIHRLLYDEDIPVETLVKRICDIKQSYTLYAGARPFGVSFIFLGVDGEKAYLYGTEPGGSYAGYKAHAVGMGAQAALEILEKELAGKELKLEEGIRLAIKVLKKISEKEITPEQVELGIVEVKTKKFRKLSQEEIEKYFKTL
jgi:proteasome alpha subunit